MSRIPIAIQMKGLAERYLQPDGFLQWWLTSLSDADLNLLNTVGIQIASGSTPDSGFADFLGCVYALVYVEHKKEPIDISHEDIWAYFCPALSMVVTYEQLRRAGVGVSTGKTPANFMDAVSVVRAAIHEESDIAVI